MIDGMAMQQWDTGAYLRRRTAETASRSSAATIAEIVAVIVLCKHMSPDAGNSIGSPSSAG
jgi:hypothetical protein